ncbi:MAG: ATP-binding cassette domain-containing protein [Thermoplasmata archaeon]|nr:ATP-binding cassette domain-containing protein [Thermoplasmata archaeon]
MSRTDHYPAARPVVQLEFHDVSKGYKAGDVEVPVLIKVNLEVSKGEILVILGPSGSGKTTLLNLAAGIDKPDEGTVVVGSRDLAGLSEDELTRYRRTRVGYVFQFFNLLPTLTAKENVAVALELLERPDDEEVARALHRVGLGGMGDRFPHQLSGGEQQRVAIARAIVKRPALIVADEPTGNLDEETGAEVFKTLTEVNRDAGSTLIIATHDAKARQHADRVMRLKGGKLEEF